MNCPKCKSEDVVIRTSTTSTVSKTYGFWWRKVSREEKTETCRRCLDCGHEWEGKE